MKKFLQILTALAVLLLTVILILFIKYADNTTLQVSTYQVFNEKIPAPFHGFRIAQVADLHNAKFGEDNSELVSLLAESDPDIIVFTGDQLDARKKDTDTLLNFVRQTVEIAPCYLVTGNHEGSIAGMDYFHTALRKAGVVILEDQVVELSHNGAVIDLIGLDDPTRNKRYYSHGAKVALETSLQELQRDKERYSILLAHRPEYIHVYERNGIDLALCGHNHGGQIRIGNRGVIGAGKELFPEYDAGLYTRGDATMVLSRGLGNSIFPWRVNNPPELVIVELIAK